MGPQHVIMGDGYGIDLPETKVDETILKEEEKLAKYSKTREYKRLKSYLEDRIAHYQTTLPNGLPVDTAAAVTPADWVAANTIIKELKGIIYQYESAAEVVEATKRKV